MRNKTVTLIILANLAALLALTIFAPHLMIQPGKLMDAHLELTGDCFACHSPFLGSSPEKCVQCHKVEEIGLRTTQGLDITKEKKSVAFHQRLTEEDCVACHSDHKGVQAFKPIGRFSHELVALETRAQCAACHSNPSDPLHQKITGNCAQCHTIDGWTPADFEHDEFFRFDRHHPADCETCHIPGEYSSYTCFGCHEHSRAKIRAEHVEEGIYDYENCVECHRSGDEEEAERTWYATRSKPNSAKSFDSDRYRGERKRGNKRHDEDD
ncbi:MAG: class III cytochrome C family protein [Gammaproteobacteria bacterium]|nr:class III cytochrome C family protein [Gammaproteobacteria bacterium]MCB1849573.1 class III cytochrome C family protein [Gammaproteobacteria bacterium]